jgi:hypothetical protein
VLKYRIPTVPIHEQTQVVVNKSIVKKNRRHKEQINSDLNFTNKRPGKLISRSLRNRQRDHLSLIPVIEVDRHLSEDEIDNFLGHEDVYDHFL